MSIANDFGSTLDRVQRSKREVITTDRRGGTVD